MTEDLQVGDLAVLNEIHWSDWGNPPNLEDKYDRYLLLESLTRNTLDLWRVWDPKKQEFKMFQSHYLTKSVGVEPEP